MTRDDAITKIVAVLEPGVLGEFPQALRMIAGEIADAIGIVDDALSSEQLQALRNRIAMGRQPITRAEMNPHPRGWNDGFDTIERWIKEILSEKVSPE